MKKGPFEEVTIAVGIVLLALISVLFLRPHTAVAPSQGSNATSSNAGIQGSSVAIASSGPTHVREVTTVPGEPDLTHKVVYASNLSPGAVTQLKGNIATLRYQLRSDPSQMDLWLSLALNYKIAGDYKAAEVVWLYMARVSPTNAVPYANLGDLYQNFLHNYPAAETNYLMAVGLRPDNIDMYRDLYTLYRYQYKTNTTAAADILIKGLAANPGNADLLQLQGQLSPVQ